MKGDPGREGKYPAGSKFAERHARPHEQQGQPTSLRSKLSPCPVILVCWLDTGTYPRTISRLKAQQHPDDDQYGAYYAGQYDLHMEERLVEALDFHVQDSVNKALVNALRPFAQPIFNFGVRCFGAGSGNPTLAEVNINEPGQSSSYDPLEQSINAILNDHEYEAFKSHKATPFLHSTLNISDESNSSDSDDKSTPDKTQGKRMRK
ncbi:hypothetical protein NDU88_004998 [Pleurodeles waltl]|uniref:Uncharacterized protein n=1 Tax=Pleurodeles waltl TaxID=8319 RepID=A0AAV7T9J0_PLEWA|nr:hypothetical protein NDU88_004998 [Pleurodeles waltl]